MHNYTSYREHLEEVSSIQAQKVGLSVVEDGCQVPVLQWDVVGNVPHRYVFCHDIIVAWILWRLHTTVKMATVA